MLETINYNITILHIVIMDVLDSVELCLSVELNFGTTSLNLFTKDLYLKV